MKQHRFHGMYHSIKDKTEKTKSLHVVTAEYTDMIKKNVIDCEILSQKDSKKQLREKAI